MRLTIDGDEFRGTPEEIVRQLHESAFLREPDDRSYVEAVAERVFKLTSERIDPQKPEAFLRGLRDAGLCWIEEEGDDR